MGDWLTWCNVLDNEQVARLEAIEARAKAVADNETGIAGDAEIRLEINARPDIPWLLELVSDLVASIESEVENSMGDDI